MPQLHQTEPAADDQLAVRVTRAAAMLDVSRAYLYELIAANKVRSVRIGGTRRIPIDELRRLAAEGTS